MKLYFENLNGVKKDVFENFEKFKFYNDDLHLIKFYDEEGKAYLLKDLPTVVQQRLYDADAFVKRYHNILTKPAMHG